MHMHRQVTQATTGLDVNADACMDFPWMLPLVVALLHALHLSLQGSRVEATAPTVFAPLRRYRRVDGTMALLKGQYTTHWIKQPVDHFSRVQQVAAKTWRQRYVVCTDFWNPSDGPIFFYAGNEADVMLYVNATGLMWESALHFGALLVFAEHRYYGASQPFGPDSWRQQPGYLTSQQAMADFAHLMHALRNGLLPGAQD
ncbi:hypothetical protein QJQ45_018104, partial [Haematococcus lacustris]